MPGAVFSACRGTSIPYEQTAPLVWLRCILPPAGSFPVMKNKVVVFGTCENRIFDAYPQRRCFLGCQRYRLEK